MTERARPVWSELLVRLEAVGFKPSRRFGQNFLLDEAVCRDVVRFAGVAPGDFVLEVGVGLGFLTHWLLDAGARVLGVEVDGRLATIAGEWLERSDRLELLVVDALAGKHRIEPQLALRLPETGDWHLCSNLPYAIASPLVAELLRLENPPRSITALVQREVAERLCAAPGDREWSALGARVALTHAGRIGRSVPAQLFRPRPKVDSAICRLERRDPPQFTLAGGEVATYDALVSHLFTQRRKRLRSPLADLVGGLAAADGWLQAAGLDPALRVEAAGPTELVALAQSLGSRRICPESGAAQPPDPR